MKFDIWRWMVDKDDIVLSLIEILAGVRDFYGLKTWKYRKQGDELIKKDRRGAASKKVMVVLNAPSIKEQPLERLKNLDLIFVNQGFRLPCYKSLKPKYHVFIDTKLIHGVWDIRWLDEIHDMVPDITFVLPASWAMLPLLKPYIAKGYRIIWIGSCIGGMRGIGVSGTCFDLALKLGYSRMYFTGFEATSFAASLLKQSSHFYGNDADESLMTPDVIVKGYYMNMRQYRELMLLARKFKEKGIEVWNLTKGGLLDMFPRKKFDEVFPA